MGNFLETLNIFSKEESISDNACYNISCCNCHKKITKKNPYMFTLQGTGKYNNKIFCSNCLKKLQY